MPTQMKTRKLSYRKDDRAMRPIWVPWKFSRVPSIGPLHKLTFAEIFNGRLFESILWMCVQDLNFVALPVPGIIGGIQKIWAVHGYAHAPFSPKILMGFCSDGPCECSCQIWSPQLHSSWDNSDWSFGCSLSTPIRRLFPKFLMGFCSD